MLVIPLDLWSKEVKHTLKYVRHVHSNRLSGPDAQKQLKPKKIRSYVGWNECDLSQLTIEKSSWTPMGAIKVQRWSLFYVSFTFLLPEPDSWAERKLSQAVKSDSTLVKVDHTAILHPQTSQAQIISRFWLNNTYLWGKGLVRILET